MDEKQFRRDHSYISSLVDLEGSRVLEVFEDRTEESSKKLLESGLSKTQREKIEAVALNIWPAYANAVDVLLPNATIVHDRFHIMQHLTEAVNKVRRHENKQLIKQGDDRLKGSRYLWLTNGENLGECFREASTVLKCSDQKVTRAWGKGTLKSNTTGQLAVGWIRLRKLTECLRGVWVNCLITSSAG
ncbi:transposase [Microbulbifer thermotolerans]|uniref:transposase n=1 Tax=Microbulbifer thermotolerans TaxID=252514 RepID=UPI00224B1D41|nr:transposase [Microbulbifer thermotolerans]MCX2780730.1 transposase [Microbulbifer thermotolerans]MCX2806471.1 transposase [Microbulbifer thermotolerans]MCX2841582.1 transposase [Microbulbifer thermotolerans]